MYKEIIERDRKIKLLLDKNNWKWDINRSNQPAYYIDSQGLQDAQRLVSDYIDESLLVQINMESDHLDKQRKLVVIKFTPGGERAVLYRLVESGRVTSDLCIAWLTRTTATKSSEWRGYLGAPDSIECVIFVGVLHDEWDQKAVKCQKNHVLRFLQKNMGVPVSGRLYLDGHTGNPHLIWHSCPRCDQPPSICERLFGNWWGRHIPDQWGC